MKGYCYESIFGTNSTSWNIKHQQLFGNYTDSLVTNSDTIVDGKVWKEIKYFTFFNSNPTLMPFNCFLREDVEEGKVWYFSSSDTTKKLIMNLSLNLNDTFNLWNYGGSQFYIVDSIYFINGLKHLRMNCNIYYENNEKVTFIEGVGTNIGLRYCDNGIPGLNPYLLCNYKNGQVDYSSLSYPCNTIFNSIRHIKDKELNYCLFYHKNNIHFISNQNTHKLQISIYNSLGQVFENKTYFNTTHETISLYKITNSLYFITANVDNSIYKFNFIKNENDY